MKLHILFKYMMMCTMLFFTACAMEDANSFENIDYREQNETDIVNYLIENNISATKSSSGLFYTITQQGTGNQPTATDDITVNYKGYYKNGTVFDASTKPTSFKLKRVIAGWTEGFQYFKEGAKGTLFIPAHLGYGSRNFGSIPGGSVLIFDVELIKIN